MPWIEALLRGQKVFARATPDGSLVGEGGRVEIRYKKGDTRAYRAAAANLVVPPGAPSFPDDAFGEGQLVESKPAATGSSKPGAPKPARLDKKAYTEPTRTADGWLAYTDGACSGNPGPAGAGFVIIPPGGAIAEGYEFLGTSTNNVAELTGILRALEVIPAEAPSILIHTDSQYSIGVLTKGWKAKANQELVAKTKELLKKRPQARLAYVPGHAGVPMNERADELARAAITTRRSQGVTLA